MSVKHESLEMKPAERKPEAPELEYKAASQDSLSMFFAAIGGAVLGMLATLLVLALVNGGTDTADNRRELCDECHRVKTAQDMGYKERAKFDAQGRVVW